MTTIASGRLSETLQTLVDARLDTIDRMLLGRVNRHDRLAIVREVESQIFDLLHGRDAESLDRDDVLAVLSRLDPPEAYLPDEATGEYGPPRPAIPSRAFGPSRPDTGSLPLTSGILGIVSLVMVVFTTMLVLGEGSGSNVVLAYVLFFSSAGLTFTLGLLAVITAARVRLRGAWAITGLVTGIISLLSSVFGTLFILAG